MYAIQTAYYQKARNPSLQKTLQTCAFEVGLDADTFIRDLNSQTINIELNKEIEFARSLGVASYPSLCLIVNKKQFPIAIDYLDRRTMIDKIIGFCQNF